MATKGKFDGNLTVYRNCGGQYSRQGQETDGAGQGSGAGEIILLNISVNQKQTGLRISETEKQTEEVIGMKHKCPECGKKIEYVFTSDRWECTNSECRWSDMFLSEKEKQTNR